MISHFPYGCDLEINTLFIHEFRIPVLLILLDVLATLEYGYENSDRFKDYW
jgi:hypothetical protein